MSQDRHQTRLPQPAPRGFQNQSVLRYTLSASGLSLESSKVAVAQRLSLIRSPDAPSLCEKSGLVARAIWQRFNQVLQFEPDGHLSGKDGPELRIECNHGPLPKSVYRPPGNRCYRISVHAHQERIAD